MSRYNFYTALIGALSVFFALSIALGNFSLEAKVFLVLIGVVIFLHSAWILYRAVVSKIADEKISESELNAITQIVLLNENGETVAAWELYGKTSVVIGKDIGENLVDIDLSQSPYAAMIDVEHAVLNYAGSNWYVEDLDSENGISIKKADQDEIYKLSISEPCKLDFGDIIFIGMCRLRLN